MNTLAQHILYQGTEKAAAYEKVWQQLNPTKHDPSIQLIYQQAAEYVGQQYQSIQAHCVGLAAGNGQKETSIHAQLESGSQLTLVDMSAELLALTNHHYVVKDILSWPSISMDLDEIDCSISPRIFTLFGFLPLNQPDEILKCLSQVMKPNDVLLVSANLMADQSQATLAAIVQQYNNSWMRNWLSLSLKEVSAEALNLSFKMDHLSQGVTQLSFNAMDSEQQVLAEMFRSYRYTKAYLDRLFQALGYHIDQSWVSYSHEESVWLLKIA